MFKSCLSRRDFFRLSAAGFAGTVLRVILVFRHLDTHPYLALPGCAA